MTDAPAAGVGRLRIDKWLWHARFFKTRALAAKLVAAGRLRRNGDRIAKPGAAVAPGDTLTFPQGDAIRVVRVIALGTRRGPATEAQALYDDLAPRPDADPATALNDRENGSNSPRIRPSRGPA